jgi:hypothetical protein
MTAKLRNTHECMHALSPPILYHASLSGELFIIQQNSLQLLMRLTTAKSQLHARTAGRNSH